MRGVITAVVLGLAAPAAADPLRLRGDAFATARTPGGLVSLTADGEAGERVRAEAVLWLGNGGADALVAAIEARDAEARATGKLGRFVVVAGALRPLHLDGGHARVRLPARITVEAFGGVPVSPVIADASWDWAVGARASRLVGDWGSVGAAILHQRDRGREIASELGVDASAAIGARSDAGARVAFDAIHGALADAQVTATTRRGPVRLEVHAGERSAAHLLPATSLFTVLGDVPSRRAGVGGRWRAAPRLDLRATVGALVLDRDAALDLTARVELRLDDRGAGALGVELRRGGGVDGPWSGVRGTARYAVRRDLTVTAELELVRPDDVHPTMAAPQGGAVWPWAVGAARWRRGAWDVAGAIEAGATPSERYRIDALVRLGRRWEVR